VISDKNFEINKPTDYNDTGFYWNEKMNRWYVNSESLKKSQVFKLIPPDDINGLLKLIEKNEIIRIFESRTVIYTQGLKSENLRNFWKMKNKKAEKMTTCKFFIRLDARKHDDNIRNIIEIIGLKIISLKTLEKKRRSKYLSFMLEIPEDQKEKARESDWNGILVRDFIDFNEDKKEKIDDSKSYCNICGEIFASRGINNHITRKHESLKTLSRPHYVKPTTEMVVHHRCRMRV
jgi:hypothetical protein